MTSGRFLGRWGFRPLRWRLRRSGRRKVHRSAGATGTGGANSSAGSSGAGTGGTAGSAGTGGSVSGTGGQASGGRGGSGGSTATGGAGAGSGGASGGAGHQLRDWGFRGRAVRPPQEAREPVRVAPPAVPVRAGSGWRGLRFDWRKRRRRWRFDWRKLRHRRQWGRGRCRKQQRRGSEQRLWRHEWREDADHRRHVGFQGSCHVDHAQDHQRRQ